MLKKVKQPAEYAAEQKLFPESAELMIFYTRG